MCSWSIYPLTYRVKSRLLGASSLKEEASEIRELCSVEKAERPAAVYLDGQLEKICAFQEWTSPALEKARYSAGPVRHEAAYAYKINDALLHDGNLYCGRARIQLVYEKESLIPSYIDHITDEVAIPSSMVGSRYFGHFIVDDCCTALVARELADIAWIDTTILFSEHVQKYLEIFQLPTNTLRTSRLRQAWLFQDFAMNSHKRRRLSLMRDQVRNLPGLRTGHGVFFRRRGAGVHRGLVNEEALEQRLIREGYEIVDVTKESLFDIIELTKDAEVVVGVEGSALMHGILSMNPKGVVVCIQPPYRFGCLLKDHTDAYGITFGFVVGQGSPKAFKVDEDELLQTIEKALSSR